MANKTNTTKAQLLEELDKAEARLRSLEEDMALHRTTKLADSLPQVVFEIDELGAILYANEYARELFGYTPEELETGLNIVQVMHPSNFEWTKKNVRRVISGEVMPSQEYLALKHDGATFPAKIYSKLIVHEDGRKTIRGVLMDISDIKEVERALRKSEERYQLVVQSGNDGIWDWDLETDEIYFSPRYKEILGYADHEFASDAQEWKNRIHPDDLSVVMEENNDCIQGKINQFEVQYRIRHQDGNYRWILGRGACARNTEGIPVRLAGTHTDITRRREAEQALRESEARHHALSSATFEAILILDNGVIMEANQAAVEMIGYPMEELIGRKSVTLVTKDYQALARRMITQNSEAPYEAILEREDGSTFPAEIRGRSFNHLGISVRAVAVRDLTWRKAVEEKYSDIVHNAIEGIYRTTREGRFLTANPAIARIMGYESPEELVDGITDIKHQCYVNPDVRDVFITLMERHGRVTDFEHQVYDKHKNKIWLSESSRAVRDQNGKLLYYEGFIVDITKRKYVENTTMALYSISKAITTTRDLQELYETIHSILGRFVDSTNFLIALKDEGQNRLGFPYFEDELAISDAEGAIARQKASLLVLEVVRSEAPLLLTNDRPQDIAKAEQVGLTGPLPAVWLGVPLKIRNKIMGAMAVCHHNNPQHYTEEDVDFMMAVSEQVALAVERKSNEEELHRANIRLESRVEKRTRELRQQAAELAKANVKLQELDQVKSSLISSISHELRTPLTSVRGFAKLTGKDFKKYFSELAEGDDKLVKKAERIMDNLAIIDKEGTRLTRLINDFLDLNRIESGKTQWNDEMLDTATVIRQAYETVQGDFSGNPDVDLVMDVQPGLHAIYADSDKVEQVLLNLLNNASKFTRKGRVTILARNQNSHIQISVADTGMGIAEEEHQRIFDKFHKPRTGDTVTWRSDGTGLGLSICREIVQHYGGKIWVESTPGHGSTFTFTLPAIDRSKAQ